MAYVSSCDFIKGERKYVLYWDQSTDIAEETTSEQICAASDFKISHQIVDVLIALDRSSSMTEKGLWKAMGQALTQVTSQTQNHIDYGLLVFPSLRCNSVLYNCDGPLGVHVKVGEPDAVSKIAESVSPGGVDTCGSTPTGAALRTSLAYLNSLDNSHERYVLLATDGAPNCNNSLSCLTCRNETEFLCISGLQCLDDTATVKAARALAESGYPVYVLGMGGSAEWAAVMNAIAAAGGTNSYYAVEDTAHLVEALERLTSEVISCNFNVDWEGLDPEASKDPAKVNFYCKQSADENESLQNLLGFDEGCKKGTGWSWVDGDTVEFCEEACNNLRARGCETVTATFGCATIPVM